ACRSTASVLPALAVLPPENVRVARVTVEHARQHEEQIGKPVHVLAYGIAHRTGCTEVHQRALRTPAHGPRDVREARRAGAAGAGDDVGESMAHDVLPALRVCRGARERPA